MENGVKQRKGISGKREGVLAKDEGDLVPSPLMGEGQDEGEIPK